MHNNVHRSTWILPRLTASYILIKMLNLSSGVGYESLQKNYMPSSLCNWTCMIALSLFLSILIPHWCTKNPRKLPSVTLKAYLDGFVFGWWNLIFWNTFSKETNAQPCPLTSSPCRLYRFPWIQPHTSWKIAFLALGWVALPLPFFEMKDITIHLKWRLTIDSNVYHFAALQAYPWLA